MTRLVLLALLLGCGPTPARLPPPQPAPVPHQPARARAADAPTASTEPGRLPTLRERRVIEHLSLRARQVRQLSFRRRVDVRIQSSQAIVAHLTTKLEEENLDEARILYGALGLWPPELEVRDLFERVIGEQVLGFYDHELARLVVRDDVMEDLRRRDGGEAVGRARATIVHELVHALQDQYAGLGDVIDDADDSDPSGAVHALVEGDATLAMIRYIVGPAADMITGDTARLRQVMDAAGGDGNQELAEAPAIMRFTLMSSYIDGLLFAADLFARGGWAAVDNAYRSLPVSAEQVLHIDRYLAGELPDAVRIPALPALARAGLALVKEDSLGELEMGIYFGQLRDDIDRDAAHGWSGDRLQVFSVASGTHAALWFSAWDDVQEAREAATASRQILRAMPEPTRALGRVERSGRALLIIRQLPEPLHAPVMRAFRDFATQLPATPPTAHGPP